MAAATRIVVGVWVVMMMVFVLMVVVIVMPMGFCAD